MITPLPKDQATVDALTLPLHTSAYTEALALHPSFETSAQRRWVKSTSPTVEGEVFKGVVDMSAQLRNNLQIQLINEAMQRATLKPDTAVLPPVMRLNAVLSSDRDAIKVHETVMRRRIQHLHDIRSALNSKLDALQVDEEEERRKEQEAMSRALTK